MRIYVKYFASLRESLGTAEETVDTETIGDVRQLVPLTCAANYLQPNTLVAVNQRYASMDAPLADGDEVAFFPPVTGG